MNFKIVSAVCVIMIVAVFIWLPREDLNNEKSSFTQNAAQGEQVSDSISDAATPNTNLVEKVVGEAALENTATQIVKKRTMRFEDDWCVVSEDLSRDDLDVLHQARDEWLLQRGVVLINRGLTDNAIHNYEPAPNSEYVESYEALDLDSLIDLANQDDVMALRTLIQLPEVDLKTKVAASKKLVILGDTSMALDRLVINELVNVKFRYQETKQFDEEIRRRLITALVYVEYGLQQLDVSALNTYLMFVSDIDDSLGGLNPDYQLDENTLGSIAGITRDYVKKLDTARDKRNLPPLAQREVPEKAQIFFEEQLAMTYREYAKILDNGRVFKHWQQSYLKKSPCLERLIARH